MTFQSELLSPITHELDEGSGRVEPGGQVLAADDDDDMEWADYEEQVQHPSRMRTRAMSESRKRSPRFQLAGRSIPDKVVSQEYETEVWRAQCHSPRRNADSTT